MNPGNIIFTYKGNWLSKLVRSVSRRKGDDIKMTHCALAITSKTFIETDISARLCPVEILEDNKYYEIWENPDMSNFEIEKVSSKAITYFGRYYSLIKLGLHALDAYLSKIFSRDIFLFRRLSIDDKYIICTWIISCSYNIIGVSFTQPYYIATPDNIYDFVKEHNWKLVKKKC